MQLSLWPAGLSTNGEGTIDWAGGLVDWDSPYMQNGYYYAMVKDISVECYDPPSDYQNNGNKVYYYTSTNGLESDIATGNNDTVLASFFASGDDMDKDPNKATGTQTTEATMTATPETVPGLSGGGNQGISGSQSGTGNTDGTSGSGQGAAAGGSTTGSGSTDFSQGEGMDNTGSGGGGTNQASQVVAGSAVALLGFFVAALML